MQINLWNLHFGGEVWSPGPTDVSGTARLKKSSQLWTLCLILYGAGKSTWYQGQKENHCENWCGNYLGPNIEKGLDQSNAVDWSLDTVAAFLWSFSSDRLFPGAAKPVCRATAKKALLDHKSFSVPVFDQTKSSRTLAHCCAIFLCTWVPGIDIDGHHTKPNIDNRNYPSGRSTPQT